MTYYERALPHWQPEGAALFLTWRLHGSLPKEYFEATGTQIPPVNSCARIAYWTKLYWVPHG
jgi:hypothetical protein